MSEYSLKINKYFFLKKKGQKDNILKTHNQSIKKCKGRNFAEFFFW